jgi:hypothetical protein
LILPGLTLRGDRARRDREAALLPDPLQGTAVTNMTVLTIPWAWASHSLMRYAS